MQTKILNYEEFVEFYPNLNTEQHKNIESYL